MLVVPLNDIPEEVIVDGAEIDHRTALEDGIFGQDVSEVQPSCAEMNRNGGVCTQTSMADVSAYTKAETTFSQLWRHRQFSDR